MISIFKKELWSKELIAWYMYDFANSFVIVNAAAYFSQWIVVDRGLSDFWFSLPFIISTVILVFLSTYVGRVGDLKGNHGKFFSGFTLLSIVSVIAIFLCGRLISGTLGVALALVFFGIYQFGYQLALVPYSAFIKYITDEKTYGKVSGLGFAFGQLGNVIGILVTLPIINHRITFFGTDRLSPLIPSLILFCLFFLPSFIIFRKKYIPPAVKLEKSEPVWRAFYENLKESRKHKGVFNLLISYYFFSDAIATLSLFSAIYLERVFGIADSSKVIILIIVMAGIGIGSLIGGVLADKIGHRKILASSLLVGAVAIGTMALNKDLSLLSVIFLFVGLATGVVAATSRSYLASLVPKNESGTFFGLYTFAERSASVVGPLVWGFIILVFANSAPANYRIAAFVMGIFLLFGAIPFLSKQKSLDK